MTERERLADLIRSFAVMCTRAEALAEVERFEQHIAHQLARSSADTIPALPTLKDSRSFCRDSDRLSRRELPPP